MGTGTLEEVRELQPANCLDVLQTTVAYLGIDGMVCGHCALRVRHALLQPDGVALVGLSLADKLAYVAYDPARIQPAQLVDIVTQASQGSSYHYEVTQVQTLAPGFPPNAEQDRGCQVSAGYGAPLTPTAGRGMARSPWERRSSMRLALRNLIHEKVRLGLSITGVALAIMLVLLLTGFQSGMNQQVTAYLTRSPGALVVAQEGVSNLLGATSLLPQGTSEAVRGVEGVESALPILSQFIILDLHGKKQPVYLIGYDPALGGGPWRLAEGREPTADDEVVFDRVLAERHDLALGGSFALMDRTVRIVGLSDETTSWMTSFLFVRKSAVEQLLRAPDATSYLLVQPAAGMSPSELQAALSALPAVDVVTKEEMKENDLTIFVRVFSAPLTLMVGIAFLVGTLVVGLIIYTATVERQREYGVLKAVGSRNGLLYRVVLIQALVAAVAGALLGVGLSLGAARLIMALRPQFLIAFEPTLILRALVAGLGMAVLAAIVPARTVARLAPAEIFRR